MLSFAIVALFASSLFSMNSDFSRKELKSFLEKSYTKRVQISNLNKKDLKGYYKNSLQGSGEFQALDSLMVDYSSLFGTKYTSKIEYDSRGNAISIIAMADNGEGQYETERNYYEYNSYKNMISEEYTYLDEESMEWIFEEKFTYTYDGNVLKESIQYGHNGEDWEMYWKYEYVYDNEGKLTVENTYNYSGEWMLDGKFEYIYNGAGVLKEKVRYYYTGSEWYVNEKIYYNYANGRLMDEAHVQVIEGEEYEVKIIEYQYDNSEFVTNVKVYEMGDEDLQATEETQYQYDNYGNLKVQIEKILNFETGELENFMKTDFSYNMNYTRDQLLLPDDEDGDFIEGQFNNMPTKMDMKFWAEVFWMDLGLNGQFYFSPRNITLDVKDIRKSNFSVYPNPVSEKVIVNLDTKTNSADMKLYDMTGKEVASQNLMMRNELNIQSLIPGVYVYVINENGTPYSGKIVKE